MAIREFADADQIADWARPAMRWAIGQGVISGKAQSELRPKAQATRGEVATIFKRYCELNLKSN